jgi:hypothetical protein
MPNIRDLFAEKDARDAAQDAEIVELSGSVGGGGGAYVGDPSGVNGSINDVVTGLVIVSGSIHETSVTPADQIGARQVVSMSLRDVAVTTDEVEIFGYMGEPHNIQDIRWYISLGSPSPTEVCLRIKSSAAGALKAIQNLEFDNETLKNSGTGAYSGGSETPGVRYYVTIQSLDGTPGNLAVLDLSFELN